MGVSFHDEQSGGDIEEGVTLKEIRSGGFTSQRVGMGEEEMLLVSSLLGDFMIHCDNLHSQINR